ncbi:MAG TPA: DUF1127 domain-containing protein [Pseudolabrys sp.]
MSIRPFKFPPDTFVKHDEAGCYEVENTTTHAISGKSDRKQSCSNAINASNVLLRDDHIVLLAIDGLLALHARIKKWRRRRRTMRALAHLDERQLRDIGLTETNTVDDIASWGPAHGGRPQ